MFFSEMEQRLIKLVYYEEQSALHFKGCFIRLRQDTLRLAAERIGLRQGLRPDKMARRASAQFRSKYPAACCGELHFATAEKGLRARQDTQIHALSICEIYAGIKRFLTPNFFMY